MAISRVLSVNIRTLHSHRTQLGLLDYGSFTNISNDDLDRLLSGQTPGKRDQRSEMASVRAFKSSRSGGKSIKRTKGNSTKGLRNLCPKSSVVCLF